MKFKASAIKNPVPTSDPFYDLTDGGYIKPAKMLADKQEVERVNGAISIVKEFLQKAEEAGAIEIQ